MFAATVSRTTTTPEKKPVKVQLRDPVGRGTKRKASDLSESSSSSTTIEKKEPICGMRLRPSVFCQEPRSSIKLDQATRQFVCPSCGHVYESVFATFDQIKIRDIQGTIFELEQGTVTEIKSDDSNNIDTDETIVRCNFDDLENDDEQDSNAAFDKDSEDEAEDEKEKKIAQLQLSSDDEDEEEEDDSKVADDADDTSTTSAAKKTRLASAAAAASLSPQRGLKKTDYAKLAWLQDRVERLRLPLAINKTCERLWNQMRLCSELQRWMFMGQKSFAIFVLELCSIVRGVPQLRNSLTKVSGIDLKDLSAKWELILKNPAKFGLQDKDLQFDAPYVAFRYLVELFAQYMSFRFSEDLLELFEDGLIGNNGSKARNLALACKELRLLLRCKTWLYRWAHEYHFQARVAKLQKTSTTESKVEPPTRRGTVSNGAFLMKFTHIPRNNHNRSDFDIDCPSLIMLRSLVCLKIASAQLGVEEIGSGSRKLSFSGAQFAMATGINPRQASATHQFFRLSLYPEEKLREWDRPHPVVTANIIDQC
jgi:hypothetical protein